MIEFDASFLRSCTIDDRYEAAVCSEEYEIGWNRPDIKSTALTWRFFWEAVEIHVVNRV